jgi:hypothetical protein
MMVATIPSQKQTATILSPTVCLLSRESTYNQARIPDVIFINDCQPGDILEYIKEDK